VKLLLLLRLWNYLRGYVIILVEGYFIEKFLNICIRRQIMLWDIKRQKDRIVLMKVSIKGFRLLRPIAAKTKCRVRIVKKRGLPFIFNKYRKRKTFAAGAVFFLISIFVMTSFVWSVEISGNKELTADFLRKALAGNGIKPGVLKYKINADRAVDDMMLNFREISWISINVRGTKVKVQLRERKKLPEIIPADVPCDIVALKDGVIKQIVVTEGIEAVMTGETVKVGQILISGRIPVKDEKDKFRQVHAMGSVKARTWYEEQQPVKLQEVEKIRTGRSFNNYTLVLFGQRINLFHKKMEYDDYDTVEVKKELMIGEDMIFPFELITDRYFENRLVAAGLSEEDARNAAARSAYEKALGRIPPDSEIVGENVKFIDDKYLGTIAKVTVECIEDIGSTRVIGGN